MIEEKRNASTYVFGLDIGTRSIVGTVGYRNQNRFIVVAQRVKEHDTRAMLDGQIHDIQKVGDTIRMVKQELEEAIGEKLKGVCIAAAGRVLRTVTTHEEIQFQNEQEISKDDIYRLVSSGVEKAYQEFLNEEKDSDVKFYCVGHSVVRYYLNGYPMGNLEEHKGRNIGVDLIATFLPDDVVDGLYKAVEIAGLEVASLTLEPIAAIQLAIPERFRMLNIALIDVGAGTSDISITNDGCIIAYGMIPVAGDILTETIAKHCLVDFAEAERIKREAGKSDTVSYMDIMLLPQTIRSEEVNELLLRRNGEEQLIRRQHQLQTRFEQEDFLRLLRTCKAVVQAENLPAIHYERITDVAKCSALQAMITRFEGSPFVYLQTAYEQGFSFQPYAQIAAMAASAYSDEAMEFLRYLISSEYQSQIADALPLRYSALQVQIDAAMQEVSDPLQECAAEDLRSAVGRICLRENNDEELLSIICDEAEFYFDGQRSETEAAALIANRVELYLKEQGT